MSETLDEIELDDAPPEDADLDDEGDGDDETDGGWIVVWLDGQQQIFEHPQDKTRDELLTDWADAKRKSHHFFKLGNNVLDPTAVRCFGWADDSMFPEIERFDSLQDRLEQITEAVGQLAAAQSILQQAQEQLTDAQQRFLVEESEPVQAPAPVARTGKPKAGKKPFRPPA